MVTFIKVWKCCIKTAYVYFQHCFSGFPVIHSISSGQTSFEGKRVNLTCAASNDIDSTESLRIIWYGPRGTQLTSEIKYVNVYNTTNSITRQTTSVLQLESVNNTDTGGYTCRALNHPKSYTEKRTTLKVECKNVFLFFNSVIVYLHNHSQIVQESPLILLQNKKSMLVKDYYYTVELMVNLYLKSSGTAITFLRFLSKSCFNNSFQFLQIIQALQYTLV